jgi:hypothetical protein
LVKVLALNELPRELVVGSAIARAIVAALEGAYTAAAANHDVEIGCDGYTFGVQAWRSSWFFLGRAFDGRAFNDIDDADPMRLGNAFFVRLPFANLFFYRDRSRSVIDVHHRFRGPSRVKDSIALNNQIYFGFVQPAKVTDESGLPNLVVLHRGNPFEGLTEVYIGLPFTRDELADTAWVFVEKIYEKTAAYPPRLPVAYGDEAEPFSRRDVAQVYLEEEPPKANECSDAGDR